MCLQRVSVFRGRRLIYLRALRMPYSCMNVAGMLNSLVNGDLLIFQITFRNTKPMRDIKGEQQVGMFFKKCIYNVCSISPFIAMGFLVDWNTGLPTDLLATQKTFFNLFYCKIFSSGLGGDM